MRFFLYYFCLLVLFISFGNNEEKTFGKKYELIDNINSCYLKKWSAIWQNCKNGYYKLFLSLPQMVKCQFGCALKLLVVTNTSWPNSSYFTAKWFFTILLNIKDSVNNTNLPSGKPLSNFHFPQDMTVCHNLLWKLVYEENNFFDF